MEVVVAVSGHDFNARQVKQTNNEPCIFRFIPAGLFQRVEEGSQTFIRVVLSWLLRVDRRFRR